MQRLLKCCLRAALFSAVLELPAKGSRAPRTACEYGALVQRFTARRYSATDGDALRVIDHQHSVFWHQTASGNSIPTIGFYNGNNSVANFWGSLLL
jgi:hypothetical protein